MAHSATLQPLSGGAFLCRIHHSFWNLGYYSISQGAIFSDVMKACQQAGRIGNDPVEKTLTQIPVLSYRETGITWPLSFQAHPLRWAFLLQKTGSPLNAMLLTIQ